MGYVVLWRSDTTSVFFHPNYLTKIVHAKEFLAGLRNQTVPLQRGNLSDQQKMGDGIRYEIHLNDSDTFIVIAAKGQLLSEERPAGKVSFLQWEKFLLCLVCS